jgi:hypothetical protein
VSFITPLDGALGVAVGKVLKEKWLWLRGGLVHHVIMTGHLIGIRQGPGWVLATIPHSDSDTATLEQLTSSLFVSYSTSQEAIPRKNVNRSYILS